MAITDPLLKAMWNWGSYHRTSGGSPKTRQDWANTWGDLGTAMYDWANTIYSQNSRDLADQMVSEDNFGQTAAQMRTTKPIGGAIGKFYAPPAEKRTQGVFGDLAEQMYKWGEDRVNANIPTDRGQWVGAWGEMGGQFHDWAKGYFGRFPDRDAALQRIEALALVTPPAGHIGFAYTQAPDFDRQKWEDDKAYRDARAIQQQHQFNADMALREGQLDLANQEFGLAQKAQADANAIAQKNADLQGSTVSGYIGGQATLQRQQIEADIASTKDRIRIAEEQGNAQLALDERKRLDALQVSQQQLGEEARQFDVGATGYINGQKTADRERMEADIAATRDRIRIAEQQGNADLALRERQRLDSLQIALGQQGISEGGLTGYYGGKATLPREQYETELKANPRDWVKSWFYQRNQQAPDTSQAAPIPPWLKDIATNTPAATFSGQSNTLGSFPIQAPAPNQISGKVFNNMAPSEVAGLEGLASSSGWYWPDYIKKMYASQQRQPGISADNPVQWGGF